MANKIKYGLKSVYYAKVTEGTTGDTYGTPVALPGAVSLSMTAQGSNDAFYADNAVYYNAISNVGYSGDLELSLIPDSFRKDVLGEVEASEGGLVEKSNVKTNYFALLFQFEGDESARRHKFFKCSATRPEVSSKTQEASISPVTEKVTVTAIPNNAGMVKWSVGASDSAYSTWFSSVQIPTLS